MTAFLLAATITMAPAADPPAYYVTITVLQGDPLGTVDGKSIRKLCETPKLFVEGQGSVSTVGTVFGEKSPALVKIELQSVAKGQATLKGSCSIDVGGIPRDCKLDGTMTLGETRRIRIHAASPDSQTWAEVKITRDIVINAEEELRQPVENH